jgi:hypothetical protein
VPSLTTVWFLHRNRHALSASVELLAHAQAVREADL